MPASQELKADPSLRMELWPSTRVTYLTINVAPDAEGRQAEPAVERQGAPGAELRHQQGRDHPDHDPRPRQADDAPSCPRRRPCSTARRRSTPTIRPRRRRCWPRPASPTASRCHLPGAVRQRRRRQQPHRRAADVVGQIGVRLKHRAGRQRDPHGALSRRRFPDAAPRPGRTTSPIRARSPPTSPTSRTSTRCIRATRTSGSTNCSSKSQQEIERRSARAQYKEIQEIYNGAAPIMSRSTRRPIRWRSARRSRASCRSRSATTSSRRAYVEK